MTKTKRQLRAEAVERLKNCVAARFDAESIVIALTSGRHGQSDWSLECDKLIYLLTDDANDDSTPENGVSDPDGGSNVAYIAPDSREMLEADIWYFIEHNGWFGYEYEAESYADCRKAIFKIFKEWLDRQAAITERETTKRHELFCERCEAESDKQIAELTAERDEWKTKCETCEVAYKQADAERKRYSEQIDELIAERDNLKDDLIDERGKLNRKMNALREVTRDYRNERDHYRSKFGKCIDYADAIHALMDDEGLA